MADCQNCMMDSRVQKIEEDLRELRDHSSGARQTIYDRLGKLEQQSAKTEAQYQNIMSELEGQKKDRKEEMKEIRDCLNELKYKPAHRWESAAGAGVSALIGGVVAYFIGGIK